MSVGVQRPLKDVAAVELWLQFLLTSDQVWCMLLEGALSN